MKKIYLTIICLAISLGSFAQNLSLIKFWRNTAERYEYGLMQGGVRAWLSEMASKKAKSYTGGLALIENLPNETVFQDEILLDIYVNYGNSEMMRIILGNLCGSFSMGNSVGDFIMKKYSKDPRVIKRKKENEIYSQKRENEQKEKKRLEREQEKVEEKRRIDEDNERIKRQLEQQEEARKKRVRDSLYITAMYFEDGIAGGAMTFSNEAHFFRHSGFDQLPYLKGWTGLIRTMVGREGVERNNVWDKYQRKHLDYRVAVQNGARKTVFVSFNVTTDGNVKDAVVVAGLGNKENEAAINLINGTTGKWKPAKKQGQPVESTVLLGVDF